MRKVITTLCAVVLGLAVIVGACFFLASKGLDNPVSDLTERATLDATNAAIDASGIKGRIDGALRDNTQEISKRTGLPAEAVSKMIDDINIQDWHVAPLPDDAQAKSTSEVSYGGYDATITTYENIPLITIATDMGTATFEVPKDAQEYLPYLDYL